MRILSALFDVALLPLDVAKDVIYPTFMRPPWDDDKSDTRKRIEKIEEELGL